FRAVTGSRAGTVGIDPEAAAELAVRLDLAADNIEATGARVTAAARTVGLDVPAVRILGSLAGWARRWANDLRRRALDALSAGARWRSDGVFDHLVGIGHSFVSGTVDGTKQIFEGVAGIARIGAEAGTLPER